MYNCAHFTVKLSGEISPDTPRTVTRTPLLDGLSLMRIVVQAYHSPPGVNYLDIQIVLKKALHLAAIHKTAPELWAITLEQGGRGMVGGLGQYADAIGKNRGNVTSYRNAAEVLRSMPKNYFNVKIVLDKADHLAAIH